MHLKKANFLSNFPAPDVGLIWSKIEDNESQCHHADFDELTVRAMNFDLIKIREDIKNTYANAVRLFLPPNRFEEPAWMNSDQLINVAKYNYIKMLEGVSGRSILKYQAMKENQNWLLDLFFDVKINQIKDSGSGEFISLGVHRSLFEPIKIFVSKLLKIPSGIRWQVDTRGRRRIMVSMDDKVILNNLFALSTGESLLLNMFLSIVRDFDMAMSGKAQFSDIHGIVVIDEIDLHLHSELQHAVLPELIATFPKVQFIITTHSPLFLMGMKKKFGPDGTDILNMPDGQRVDVETFSEFEDAYNVFKESEKFLDEKRLAISQSHKPVLLVEGVTDIDYIKHAAHLLGFESLINYFDIIDGDGTGNLDKYWRYFEIGSKFCPEIVILLYDFDARKAEDQKTRSAGKLIKRMVPEMMNRLMSKGIENLFSDEFIKRAKDNNPLFFDIETEHSKLCGGVQISIPEKWEVNKKKELCKWIIANGTPLDFADFHQVFDMLEKIVNPADPAQASLAP